MSEQETPPATRPRAILITGSSSGIGRALARRFGERGWRVFATMRAPDGPGGRALRDEAAERGWRLTTPALDVTRDDSVDAAVSAALAETSGRLDVLVNNAGYYSLGALEDCTPDELRAQLETNVVGVQRVTRAVLPAMRARRGGTIVTLGSISGRVAVPMCGAYTASKWALEGMIEALRLELLPFGVRVVLIEPGPYESDLHANEREAAASRRPESPYATIMAAYRRQAEALRRAPLPGLVDVIERAATSPSPRLRWPVGPTSLTAGRLRALCPDFVYEWIMRLGFPLRRSMALPPAAPPAPGAGP
ncbi:MAG TPA: SDR family oxidoreductase [Polyangia bacterium]|nr:SDR family oxidoreductase [Polyangia bacterium]